MHPTIPAATPAKRRDTPIADRFRASADRMRTYRSSPAGRYGFDRCYSVWQPPLISESSLSDPWPASS